MSIVYKSDPVRGAVWAHLFEQKAPELPFFTWPETGDRHSVRYLVAWEVPDNLEDMFPQLEVLFSISAGVDQIDLGRLPQGVPLVRMIEPALETGMLEYVTQAVISIHRDLFTYAEQQQNRIWQPLPVKPASTVRVSVLGLGWLGTSVIMRLASLGYRCAGWSRSEKAVEGVHCFFGQDGLQAMLKQTDILICLLPLTESTHGFIDKPLLEALPKGSSLVQTGRGAHLDHRALLDLLSTGHIANAILDVTDPEPLPYDHELWTHPRVRITPHIASATRPESAVEVVLDNIRRYESGQPMIGVVNRQLGY